MVEGRMTDNGPTAADRRMECDQCRVIRGFKRGAALGHWICTICGGSRNVATEDDRRRHMIGPDAETLTQTTCPIADLMTRAERFDAQVSTITQTRGETYGPPRDDFTKVDLIKQAVAHCPDPAVRHALEMIGVKMVRIATTPDYEDGPIDIAGYARTIAMMGDS